MHCPVGVDAERVGRDMSVISSLLLQLLIYGFRMSTGIRYEKLYKVVTAQTSHTWAAVLVKILLEQTGLQGMARQTPYISKEKLEAVLV